MMRLRCSGGSLSFGARDAAFAVDGRLSANRRLLVAAHLRLLASRSTAINLWIRKNQSLTSAEIGLEPGLDLNLDWS